MALNVDNNLKWNIKTNCTATGVYSIDINDYSCTKPCPLPKIPEPLLMTHNWTNTTQNAEYNDVLSVTCRLPGSKLVSKLDFNAGLATNLINYLNYTCLISGWFNDSIGSYTCTRNCSPPLNYSVVMTNDWNPIMQVVVPGTKFK